jgi:hypothetical protein
LPSSRGLTVNPFPHPLVLACATDICHQNVDPSEPIITKGGIKDALETSFKTFVANRYNSLDYLSSVATFSVGTADEHPCITTVIEIKNAVML